MPYFSITSHISGNVDWKHNYILSMSRFITNIHFLKKCIKNSEYECDISSNILHSDQSNICTEFSTTCAFCVINILLVFVSGCYFLFQHIHILKHVKITSGIELRRNKIYCWSLVSAHVYFDPPASVYLICF